MPVTLEMLRKRLAHREPHRLADATPGTRQAAVGLVLVPAQPGAGLELLLIKRADHSEDPWSGHIALPGGRREPDDTDLFATVTRETIEEVGIELERQHLLGELDDLRPRTPTLPPVVVRPFVFALDTRPPVRPSREVALSIWASLEELLSPTALRQVDLPPIVSRVNAYQIQGHTVWGMTERILTPFLDLAR